MSHDSEIKKKITFENRTYNLGKYSKARVKADISHKSSGQLIPVESIPVTSGSWSTIQSQSLRVLGYGGVAAAEQGHSHASGSSWTTTLTQADSGKLFTMDASNDPIIINLPAVGDSAGVHYRFVNKVAGKHNVEWNAGSDCMVFSGTDWTPSGAEQVHTTNTIQRLIMKTSTSGSTVVGDRVEIYCDGTNYIATGFSNTQIASKTWQSSSAD